MLSPSPGLEEVGPIQTSAGPSDICVLGGGTSVELPGQRTNGFVVYFGCYDCSLLKGRAANVPTTVCSLGGSLKEPY